MVSIDIEDEKEKKMMSDIGSSIYCAAYIDYLITDFIGVHYFGQTKRGIEFVNEVLRKENFHSGLKREIVIDIIKKYYPNEYRSDLDSKLRKIQSNRNILAHSMLIQIGDSSEKDLVAKGNKTPTSFDNVISETFDLSHELITFFENTTLLKHHYPNESRS